MSTEGAVARTQVINVLRAAAATSGISIDVQVDENGAHVVTLIKDGDPEVHIFTGKVPRRMLHALATKYGMKIEWFYYPTMIIGPATKQ